MRGLRKNGESLSYSALLALIVASGTSAAHAEGDTNVAADSQIESVTVTARRREEAVQDVPVAISVLNANTIESTGVGSSRVDLQACKLEYSIVSPK